MTHLAILIDRRRQLAAQVAGLDMQIALAVGDRDGAQRARREMEAQTLARCAALHTRCTFKVAERVEIELEGRSA